MSGHSPPNPRFGLAYGLGAYVLWGGVPIYFRMLKSVPAFEVLAHRVIWSALLLCAILWSRRRLDEVRSAFADRKTLFCLILTTLLIAINWLLFVYAVATDRLTQASLGYFICPLVSVALGTLVLKETLRWPQLIALGLAAGGVGYLAFASREIPWIGLGLAISFAVYGLLRKKAPVDGSVGLAVETLILFPLALAAVGWWHSAENSRFLAGDRATDLLLLAAGPITTVPLVLFAEAARRLKLTVLGFMQYISPTLQLLVAVVLFHEGFPRERRIAFSLIWLGIAVFCADSLRRALRDRRIADGFVAVETPS